MFIVTVSYEYGYKSERRDLAETPQRRKGDVAVWDSRQRQKFLVESDKASTAALKVETRLGDGVRIFRLNVEAVETYSSDGVMGLPSR